MPKSVFHLRLLIITTLCVSFLMTSRAFAQDMPPIIDFTPSADNPVFTRGEGDSWGGECGTIFAPQVIEYGGTFYLFYSGSCARAGRPAAIGFATSPDGIHWESYEANPVLEPDGEGYDAMCASMGVPIVDDDQWIMYYAGNSTPCAGPGQHIGRAVADAPAGPWQREPAPVLNAGERGDWDEGFIMPHAIISTEQGYVMYYSGGSEFLLPLPRLIGLATSTDGITWTKYDDPATTDAPFAHSDPIVERLADGTSKPLSAWAVDVGRTEQGWEMFFADSCPNDANCPAFIGYATSEDGIHWNMLRALESAALTRQQVDQPWASYCICQPAFVKTDADYRLYFTGCTDELNDCQIGMALGTIVREQP